MTEHKGLPVSGYRPQSEDKVQLVNGFKADEERLLRRIDALMPPRPTGPNDQPAYDGRWLAVARTHFEQGYMALNRAVFQPSRVALPEDNEPKSAA